MLFVITHTCIASLRQLHTQGTPIAQWQMNHCCVNTTGFPTFLVGGAVRDILLGNTPKDFDVLTAASNKDVRTTILAAFHLPCMQLQ